MHPYSHSRMYKNDKIGAIKISWENFTSYCSFGTIFAVDNLFHEILPQTKENIWIENEKNLMSNNIYFVRYKMMECIWGIIITIFHITLLKLGQPERFHLSNFSWIQHLRIIAYWPRLNVLLHTSTGPNTNWTQKLR